MIEFSWTFWTIDEDHFIHPRNKVQVPFLISVYCWTGARIGSFFPSEDKPDACLRYRDIQLVLLRVPGGGWKVIYNLSQRWVKNNRDPENIVYKYSTSQHEKLLHDDTQYLLAMALADRALYGIESFENLWDMSIPDGDNALPLRWKDEVLRLPVIRNATIAHGVTNAPLPKRTLKGSSSRYYIHQDILAQQRFMQYAAHWARSPMSGIARSRGLNILTRVCMFTLAAGKR